ncbi:hypothetical protein MTR_2g089460 [Medicago truncatula]|uniref:Uncharacterized protein n=1 Tax=Medicago truncatula TaxID=3880 RepID=G7IRM4_MEDTR|nr:hypothetical protein MTR_2g089460 [Medicago truncatula]
MVSEPLQDPLGHLLSGFCYRATHCLCPRTKPNNGLCLVAFLCDHLNACSFRGVQLWGLEAILGSSHIFGSNIENPLIYGEEFDEAGDEDTDDNDVLKPYRKIELLKKLTSLFFG